MEQLQGRYQRYHLETLVGTGGMGSVYRAYDRLNKQTVALKRLTAQLDTLNFTKSVGLSKDTQRQRMMLAQEFKTLAALRHPNIVSVLDYGFDAHQQPYFVMELFPDDQNILQAGEYISFERQVDYLTQLLMALDYLHRRGVIYRDLKPANVLVHHGQVKVVDFGLSQTFGTNSDELGGTIGYIPPEVLMGDPITTRCDLYAFGVITYEMLTGQHPFFDSQSQQFNLDAILTQPPSITPLHDSPLKPVILRLLEKNPAESYRDVSEVVRALYNALDRDIPSESLEVRESVLQSGRFVGREGIVGVLVSALEQTGHQRGKGFLIGGAGGVGKSRLLEEFRTQVLVSGIPVVRAQTTREQGTLYKLWQDVLREFCLLADVVELLTDERAAILKAVVPDLPTWLGRTVPDAPIVPTNLVTPRLNETLRTLFMSIREPLVIILEDLHWLHDGLPLLQAVTQVIEKSHVLMVAAYRSDEMPRLPNQLPKMQAVTLETLDNQAVIDLTASFVSQQQEVSSLAALLSRETSGNAFLIVEMLRVLADEVGLLNMAGMTKIPTAILSNGIRGVILRRLSHLPRPAQDLLRIATVIGRTLDKAILAKLFSGVALDPLIQICTEALMLEAVENEWRFSHDLLREMILNDMQPDVRRDLHGQVARAAEQLYHQDPSHMPMLAYHYWSAGDWQNTVRWSTAAISYASTNYANSAAVSAYRWLLDGLKILPDSEENRRQRLNSFMEYDEVAALVMPSTERVDILKQAEALANGLEGLERIRKLTLINVQFARLYYSLNDISLSLSYAYQAMASAQMLNDEAMLSQPWVVLGLLSTNQGEFLKAQDFLQQSLPIAKRSGNSRYWVLGQSYFMTCMGGRGHVGEVERIFAELEESGILAANLQAHSQVYGTLSLAYFHMGRYTQAIEQGEIALQGTQKTDDIMLDTLTLHFIAFSYMRMGDFARANDYIHRVQPNMRVINQEIFYRDTLNALKIELDYRSGVYDNLDERITVVKQSADRNGTVLARGIVLRVEAAHALDAGNLDRAQEHADASLALFKRTGAIPDAARAEIILAQIAQKRGDWPAAAQLFSRAEAIFNQIGADYELDAIQALRHHKE